MADDLAPIGAIVTLLSKVRGMVPDEHIRAAMDEYRSMRHPEPKRDLCARVLEAVCERGELRVTVHFYATGDVIVRDRRDRTLLDTSDGEVGGEATDDAIIDAVKGVRGG